MFSFGPSTKDRLNYLEYKVTSLEEKIIELENLVKMQDLRQRYKKETKDFSFLNDF